MCVVLPDVTRASTVSHFRVGVENELPEKSPCNTARQRRAGPVAHVGDASTSESSLTAPSSRISLT